jgi:hypothetical protein
VYEPELNGVHRAFADANRRFTGSQLLNVKRHIEQASGQLDAEVAQQRRGGRERAALLATPPTTASDDFGQPLTVPASGGLFADQLNVVRSTLQEALLTLDKHAEAARRQARAAVALLDARDSGDVELGQAIAKLQEVETGLATTAQRRDALRHRIDQYRTAAQLLAQARELHDEKLASLGDAAKPQRAALERWSNRVTGQLAAQRVEALAETAAWHAELNDIKQAASAYEQSLREAFAGRQQALRAMLIERFGQRADQLPSPLVFNPADPEESYRLLAESTRRTLEHARGRLRQQLQAIAEQARAQSRQDNLASLPAAEREPAAQEMQAVQEEAQRLAEQAEPVWSALLDGVATAEPTELAAQAAQMVALVAPVVTLVRRVSTLTQRLQAVALTPDEAAAHEVLSAVAADDDIDFAEYAQQLHERLPTADPWARLRTLTQKSRTIVRVRLVRS